MLWIQIAFCDEKISLFRRLERTTIGWKIGIDAYGINNMDLPCTGEKLLEARNQLILGASERWSRAPWTNSAFIGHLFGLAMLMSQVRRGEVWLENLSASYRHHVTWLTFHSNDLNIFKSDIYPNDHSENHLGYLTDLANRIYSIDSRG